ncbi:hypothetical protein FDJ13_gp69 [Gordonia phage Gustav]|uniref:Uncharacterized protein n=1 Tax=Gordonia phage Gustav TaxID=2047872 RepID=A0A2H4PAM4_9CAUD|nr:hypothetical protein FDJ13_gp69 [Gordonia phage Gustav]ATW59129.1 hypothetical protein PHIRE_GUSTAV_69 [Gordonia phage Gustav]
MREQHDDEPREAPSKVYRPFMPGQDQPKPNRAQRRHMAQARKRGRRRMERATVRAMREVTAEERRRPQLSEDMADDDTTTVTIDLEEGTVTEGR